MTPRLPSLKADAVIRGLRRAGFEVVRSVGSHHRMVHTQNPRRATTVPVHKGRDLPRPMLQAIIKQAGMTVEEFWASFKPVHPGAGGAGSGFATVLDD